MSPNEHKPQATRNPARTSNRRKVFVPTAIAAAMVLALGGAHLATATDAGIPPAGTTAAGPQFAAAPSFAEVAARVTPAVVNVAVSNSGDGDGYGPSLEIPELPDGSPHGQLFRRFFEQGQGHHQGIPHPRGAKGQGSGFVVDPDGYIVTNHHVVDGADEVTVILNDGTRLKAQVKGADPKTDLALLKVDAGRPLPTVTFGTSASAQVGDWVLAVGNPFGLGGSVSAGIISARGRDINSGPYDDYLQIDAPINRGNSGGPLFDAQGQVIGVNAAIFSPSGGNVGIGFAIPADMAKQVVAQLRDQGRVDRGWLGVEIQPVTEEIAEGIGVKSGQGTLVAAVMPESPAAKAGLRPGDLILRAGETEIADAKALSRLIAATPAGTSLSLEVYRDGGKQQVPLVVGAMVPDERIAAAPEAKSEKTGARLGLYLAPLTPEAREAMKLGKDSQGVVVARVEKDSPAERAGIEPGSLISMVGQQEVDAPEDVVKAVQGAAAEQRTTILLRVEQDGQRRFVAVRLAA